MDHVTWIALRARLSPAPRRMLCHRSPVTCDPRICPRMTSVGIRVLNQLLATDGALRARPTRRHHPHSTLFSQHLLSLRTMSSAARSTRVLLRSSARPVRSAVPRRQFQARFNSQQASTPTANGIPHAITGGLVGGGVVLIALYGYYHVSVGRGGLGRMLHDPR